MWVYFPGMKWEKFSVREFTGIAVLTHPFCVKKDLHCPFSPHEVISVRNLSLSSLLFCPVLFKKIKKRKEEKSNLRTLLNLKIPIIPVLDFTPGPSFTFDFKIHNLARNIFVVHLWSDSGLCNSFFLPQEFCCLIQKQMPFFFSYKADIMWLLGYHDLFS